MTVITVASTDTGSVTQTWKVPPDEQLNHSPIPRGLRFYGGTVAIPALGANDETNVAITFTFPTVFNYLMKNITIQFLSDDLTTEFDNIGLLEYRPGANGNPGIRKNYALFSDGAAFRTAAQSIQSYRPVGTWRHFLNGSAGDTLVMSLSDISNDTSTAGDVTWTAEAWQYDIEQCLKWPVNTPIPQVAY